MVIQRHKVCDMCGEPVGYNNAYTTFRMKDFIESFAGSATVNQKLHICHSCLYWMGKYIQEQKQGNKPKQETLNLVTPEDWKSAQSDE